MSDATAPPTHDPQELRLGSRGELRKALEAILLVVDEPVDVETLAQVIEVDADDVEDVLLTLAAEYVDEGRGFVLRRAAGGWRLYTDPGAASYVEGFVLHGRSGKLSQAALETLAIVAYKQPVTRSEISEIRGVDADAGVRSLLTRGLVEEAGRAETPGQPTLYATTPSFLEKLGLDSLADLPALPDLSPQGPPPPEPRPGGYKAARKELGILSERGPAGGQAGQAEGLDRLGELDLLGGDADQVAEEDAEIEAALARPTPKPGERLAAMLKDPFGAEVDRDEVDRDERDDDDGEDETDGA